MTHGFILTRQHFDTPRGVELHFWVKHTAGVQQVIIDQQEAVCFIPQGDVAAALACLKQAPALHGRMQNLALHTFDQQGVTGIYFKQQRQLYEAVERLEAAGLSVLEKDIRPTERYLMERFIRAGVSITGGQRNNRGALLNPQLKAAEFNPQFRVVSLDIETSFNSNELYCIGLTEEKNDVELVLMKGQGQDSPTLRHYPDEKSLLLAFSQWVQDYDPDIFIGWNVINFDFRFLANKFEQYRLPFNLGRQQLRGNWRTANEGQQHFVTLPGRLVVDGIDSLKAATYHFESYSLESVSRELLGAGKQIDNVDNRGEAIQNLYHHSPSALAAYNLQDCRLVEQIFDHTKVLHYLIERAYLTGLPLDKYGGSTASFDNLYLPLLHRSGYIAPDYNSGATGLNAPGGYVMESKPGLYENVLVLDFKSLYPSIIRTFFIDPMGLAIGINAEDAASDDLLAGYNGAVFSRSEHHLPGLIDTLWQARDKAKRERNAAVSQAIKIIMNSFYGVLGSPGCRFFDQRLSSSITLRGHHILQRSQHWIEQQGHQVIYGDTDSVFVWIKQDCNTAQAEAIGQALQQGLNQWWTQSLQDELALESRLEIEFETHYTRFFMPTIRGSEKGSKKRYCGQVIDTQGNKRMIFKGLESVRTDWTPLARRFQQTLYEMIFEQQDWAQFIRDTVEQLKAGELDEELIYRKRLRRKLDDYIRNVPPHVQAARKADLWLQSQGQDPRYARGGWIRYTMTLSGPEPLENSLSALDYDFYIERQLAPIADAILPLLGHHFAEFSEPQITLL